MSDQDKNLPVLPTIEDLALMSDVEKLGQETLLMIEEVVSRGNWKDLKEETMEIIDGQSKKAMEIDQNAERDELLNKVPTLGEVSTSRDASLGPSTVVMSASLPTNILRLDSPEYDEISDTEIDQYVSKPLEEDAVHEMDIKFGVLKTILEQIDDKKEKQRHFEEIYQEYAAWCEARIDSKVMMYFVHKFHTECALYMREHHGIEVNIRGYETELIRRTEDPKWTDAQKLKRKVLQRRKSNSTKKKICAQRVGDVFTELLVEEFNNVLACDPLSIAKIPALIEYSKSKRDFFSRILCKYDKYGELPKLLDKKLVDNWIFFFYCLPHNGFGESDTLNEYERVRRDLPLNVPPGTHIILLSDIKEWFAEKKNKREREERERREKKEKPRQAEILRRLEDGNNSRKIFSFLELPNISHNLVKAILFGPTSLYQEHPQAITYHQSGSRSNQRIDSGMEKLGNRVGQMQDFHH